MASQIKVLLIVGLLSAWPSLAEACIRCGRSSCSCRAVQVIHHAPAVIVRKVVPVVQAQILQQPNVYVVQNNGASTSLVPQGNTAYVSNGYQASVAPQLDANVFLASTNLLLRDSFAGLNTAQARTVATFVRIAELQAPANERLAAGQAAAMTLAAAGLGPSGASQSNSTAVVINRDAFGRVQVVPLNQQQIQNLGVSGYGGQGNAAFQGLPQVQNGAQAQVATTAPYPLLDQFCLRCHGPELAQAKGGLTIGWTEGFPKGLESRYFKISRRINDRSMPPAGSPQPTDEQRSGIIGEIESIITSPSSVATPAILPAAAAGSTPGY